MDGLHFSPSYNESSCVLVFSVSYEAWAAASEQFSQVCPVHLFSSCDRAVIFIPFVLTSEQEVIYKGLCSHEVSPSPLLMSSWTE